jgi:hypothetical protein
MDLLQSILPDRPPAQTAKVTPPLKAASMIALFTVLAITPDIPAGEAQADGWRPLFDGKSLDGWEHVGPGKMVVDDGLLCTEGGMGLRWYTREMFGNCTIRLVYKTTSKESNSGVF